MPRASQGTFHRAVTTAEENGTITMLKQINEKVYTVGELGATYKEDIRGFTLGTDTAAVEVISTIPGTMIAAPNSISNVRGRLGTTGIVMEAKSLPGVIHARELYGIITGLACEFWGVPRIARALLEWAARGEPHDDSDEGMMPNCQWHHQSCPIPGRYSDLALHDVSAYYYTLLTRLRSPRVRYINMRPVFTGDLNGQERDRWRRMLLGVERHKTLRNSLVGCMAGGTATFPCYTSGGGSKPVYRFPMHKQNGPFRAAGLLIVATGNELTYKQALTNDAIYANIDCVVIPTTASLAPVWSSYGLETGVKASGKADIKRVGVWRIGGQATKNYAPNDDEYTASGRLDPYIRYADNWLRDARSWT